MIVESGRTSGAIAIAAPSIESASQVAISACRTCGIEAIRGARSVPANTPVDEPTVTASRAGTRTADAGSAADRTALFTFGAAVGDALVTADSGVAGQRTGITTATAMRVAGVRVDFAPVARHPITVRERSDAREGALPARARCGGVRHRARRIASRTMGHARGQIGFAAVARVAVTVRPPPSAGTSTAR